MSSFKGGSGADKLPMSWLKVSEVADKFPMSWLKGSEVADKFHISWLKGSEVADDVGTAGALVTLSFLPVAGILPWIIIIMIIKDNDNDDSIDN